jgi:polar amino acid transport system substrate-binding protein
MIVMVCFWWLHGAGTAWPAEITLCADVWCPYNCTPATSHPGFAIEVAQEVFASAGYEVKYQEVNWARCVEDARAGRFTGIVGAIPTDAPDFIFPALPIGISGDAYATRAGENFQFTGEKSLQGRVLGVIRSYTFNGPIGAYIAAHAGDGSRIEFVSGDGALSKNLAKLIAHRVDVVLDDRNVLVNAVGQLGLGGRVTITNGLNATPVYIAFSPGASQSKQLARILDAGILRLRASGRLAQIKADYHVVDGS